jgi:hypothetical protein
LKGFSMNRCLVPAISFVAFCLAGTTSRPAAAQYPLRTVVVAQPTVIVNNGATYGYGGGGNYAYGSGYGYNGAVANYGVVSAYGPAAAAYGPGRYGYGYAMPGSAPYGAGYSGGWAPYQQMYYQRLYYGLVH